MGNIKRIIEVNFPLRQVSEASSREKESRMGHIPRLHIYPAARPVCASRACLLASLIPEPTSENCPKEFISDAEKILVNFSEDVMKNIDTMEVLSGEMWSHVTKVSRNGKVGNAKDLSEMLQCYIASSSTWEAGMNQKVIETTRKLVELSSIYISQGDISKPVLVDPFSGGGAIPLEGLRAGCESLASDLNPIALLVERMVLQHIPKFGIRLIDDLDKWLAYVKPNVIKEIGNAYPSKSDSEKPIAYLWARTVLSEAPGPSKEPIEIPLIRSMWLSRKKNRPRALRWKRQKNGSIIVSNVSVKYANGQNLKVLRPELEIFCPKNNGEVEAGTVLRNSATCPITGFTTSAKEVENQLKTRNGGSYDARLFCVVYDEVGKGRNFRIPEKCDEAGIMFVENKVTEFFGNLEKEMKWIPDEELPLMSGVFNAPIYGHSNWGSLFTPRQTLAHCAFIRNSRNYVKELDYDQEYKQAVIDLIAVLLDRLIDLNASLCVWQLNTPNTAHVFGRWALPMVMDFGEVNPLVSAGGSPESAIRRLKAIISDLDKAKLLPGNVINVSAEELPYPDDSVDIYYTDPPYYNAVPYADLMDFFYVWMKRFYAGSGEPTFEGTTTPKDAEICEMSGWDPRRYSHKNKDFFELHMTSALEEGRRCLKPGGIGVIVFAHKTTSGWEAMLQSLISSGWIITASWPIDTEMASRLRAKNSAALASSVHLVCRPREDENGTLSNLIGDWRDVLAELPDRVAHWLPHLVGEGIIGADAIFGCLGPALEIYTRYSSVEKTSGEKVKLREYLELVWAEVANQALNMIFEGGDTSGLEEDARLTAMWLWTLRTDLKANEDANEKVERIVGYSLEYDAARKIAQGLGCHLEDMAHLVEIKGETATLLSTASRARYLFGKEDVNVSKRPKKQNTIQGDLFSALNSHTNEELKKNKSELELPSLGKTVLDQLHQSMILFGAGRGEALKRFLVDDGVGSNPQLWSLAQSLSALYPPQTEEKRWVDGVLARKKSLGF